MTTQSPTATTGGQEQTRPGDARHESRSPATRERASVLVTERGRTAIADTVVEKITVAAAREVPGVHDLGGSVARTFGAIRERIPGSSRAGGQGVAVEVGERQAAADIDLVAEYGVPVHELAAAVRQNVIVAIESLTGLQVTEVNVNIDDIYLPEDPSARGDERIVE